MNRAKRRMYLPGIATNHSDLSVNHAQIIAEAALLFASCRQLPITLANVGQRIATIFDGVCQVRFISSQRPSKTMAIVATATQVSRLLTDQSETYARLLTEFTCGALQASEHHDSHADQGAGVSALLLGAPLIAQKRRIGAIDLVVPAARNHYGAHDQSLLRQLAVHAALAIDAADHLSALQSEESTTTHEERIAEIDRVLAMVAHDLKNPLTSLRSIMQLLRRQSATTTEPDQQQHLWSLAQSALMQLEAQIHALATPHHIKATHEKSVAEPFDLTAFVRQMISLYQLTGGRDELRLEPDPAALLGWWERQHLERIIGNLFANALKYSPAGSAIRVRLDREDDELQSWAVLSVEDSGIGIPAEDLLRLAQPHFRAGNVGMIPGSGLGLAGVRETLEQYGGSLRILGGRPGSTTVTVRLPLA